MTSLTSWFANRFTVCNQGSLLWSHSKCIYIHRQFLPRPPTASSDMTFWLARWEVPLLFLSTNASQAGRVKRFELGRGGGYVICGPRMKVRCIDLFRTWFIKRSHEQLVTIILYVVSYGCETWSLTLKEKLMLRVFENRALRRIFGPKRDEVTGEWGKLHFEELNDLHSSPNIIRVIKWRRMRWAGHVAHMGGRRVVYRVLVGKPEWKRAHGRPRCEWEDNIKMDLLEVGCGGMDWIDLGQDRDRWRTLANAVMNLRVP